MQHDGLDSFALFLRRSPQTGPIALIFAEDGVELGSTLRHHCEKGFETVAAFLPAGLALPDMPEETREFETHIHLVPHATARPDAMPEAVNRVIEATPGRWLFYCYNAEFLFYPFCESRSVGEMLAHHAEERRAAMLTYVIDLYADDLAAAPNAVSRDRAMLDRVGYYALARPDPADPDRTLDRQLNVFGGLRWRFEEHVPEDKRRIDRISLFRARPGLRLRPDHTLSDPEYNTYACPWHNSLTAAVASFRTAKALKTNPGSTFDIDSFHWRHSTAFRWHSRQLLDLGLMEPGQWF
ncbi:hypothetical protein [Cognatishimia sp. F0-27]|uniref:hypothetical protein n=1 Tax=Cognatishimia sp. F0-27 TaxID=2816855 RepID=UPI001D0C9DFA|nr:hypothetical protein [Cognatishimia sp. F0-27]MCC1494355.1 hypothetical protein [Cognatishimia sp. F0-27]